MTTKERLLLEIEKLNQEELAELFALVKSFLQTKQKLARPTFLEQLSRIQINGPEDFAENLDLYLSGEKLFDPNFH